MLLAVLSLGTVGIAQAAPDCDCTSYPFKPNPPCYGRCVRKLSSPGGADLAQVKGLEPDVAAALRVLASRPDRAQIDFDKIQSKSELQTQAVQKFEQKKVTPDAAKPTTKLDIDKFNPKQDAGTFNLKQDIGKGASPR